MDPLDVEATMSFRLRVLTGALCATIALPAVAAAQSYPTTVGIKGGVNASTLSVDESEGLEVDRIWGAVGGLFVGRNITENFGLQLEGLFSQRGGEDNTFTSPVKIRLTFLDIPLTARFGSTTTSNTHFHVFTGPQFGIKLDAEGIDQVFGQPADVEVESWDFGWTVGAGVEMNRVSFDARYTMGLTNLNTSPADPEVKNRTFSFMVGYRFR
jgi:opacity protein-like surface antigen